MNTSAEKSQQKVMFKRTASTLARSTTWMVGDWKSSLTDSLCGKAPNWHHLGLPHQGGWDRQAPCSTTGMALLWRKHEERRGEVPRTGRQRGTCTLGGHGGSGEGRFSVEATQFLRSCESPRRARPSQGEGCCGVVTQRALHVLG